LLHECNEKHETKDYSTPFCLFVHFKFLFQAWKGQVERVTSTNIILQRCSLLVVQWETHACIDLR
jgi:hypothetical protein